MSNKRKQLSKSLQGAFEARRHGQRNDGNAFVQQLFGLLAGGLAADAALLGFAIVDTARLIGKTLATSSVLAITWRTMCIQAACMAAGGKAATGAVSGEDGTRSDAAAGALAPLRFRRGALGNLVTPESPHSGHSSNRRVS